MKRVIIVNVFLLGFVVLAMLGTQDENWRGCPPPVSGPYLVDASGATIAGLIRDGNYGSVNRHINDKNFTIGEGGPIWVELVAFRLVADPWKISTSAVLDSLSSRHLRPATMVELLALGAQVPKLHLSDQLPVIALGASSNPIRVAKHAGVLWRVKDRRLIGSIDTTEAWLDGYWTSACRFAAVPLE